MYHSTCCVQVWKGSFMGICVVYLVSLLRSVKLPMSSLSPTQDETVHHTVYQSRMS
jgi:hypothetical protein